MAPQRPSRGARAGGSDRRAALTRDVAHLNHLIDVLHDRGAPDGVDDRDPELLTGTRSPTVAEQRLRAASTLLSTLDTYLRGRQRAQVSDGRDRRDDGAAMRPPRVVATRSEPGSELAAAAATYIARDLAARQLTEFTSAEAYRLARALARIGGVSDAVERWLAEANTIRLHPAPLRDAVSHSAV
ncbi:MAG TPA: hypothetical protein VFZ70_02015 [Euzebyales bacterium]